MVKVAAAKKQQKVAKKPTTATKKKIIKTTKKKPPSSTSSNQPIPVPIPTSSSDSDPDDTSPEQIHKLIEPYTKDQLINFIINAAVSNPTLYARIRDTADSDVSNRKIFVFGLGWDTTKEALIQSFQPFGEIEDCNVVIDRATGKAKGFGFVQFRSRKEAMKALKDPRKKINNRMASCQLAALGPPVSAGPSDNSWRKIYVSNVHPDTDPERLRTFFEKFGEIETGPIGFDSVTGKSRGFALFVYRSQDGFRKALEEPYKVLDGHQLHCQRASSEGKNKGVAVSPSGTGNSVNGSVVQQPTPQMMAAQNFALFNPMYGGLFAANPFLASGVLGQVGGVGGAPGGLGGYFAGAPGGLNVGVGVGSASLLGGVPPVVPGSGLQNAYPKKKMGPASPPALGSGSGSGSGSGARGQGAGGSFSGYPSHM